MSCPFRRLQAGPLANIKRVGRVSRILSVRPIAECVLVLALLLTGAAWYISKTAVDQVAKERFGFRTDEIGTLISRRLEEQEKVLRGGVGLINAAGMVNRAQWRTFVSDLQIEKFYPGLQGYAFVKMLQPQDKAAHIASVRREGFPDYDIRPSGEREIYSTVLNIEPFTGLNLRAFGADGYSEPMRRAAMEHARDSGEVAVSGPVTLTGNSDEELQRGFMMYLPVYRARSVPAKINERRASLIGYVASSFRIRALLSGILNHNDSLIDFKIFDGDEMTAQAQLYDSTDGHEVGAVNHARMTVLQVGGRLWKMQFIGHAAKNTSLVPSLPTVIAVGGIAINVLLYLIIQLMIWRKRMIADKAAALSKEIQQSGERYRAVVDTAADAIVLVDQRGFILSFNRAAETIFGYAEAEVVGQPVNLLMPDDEGKVHSDYVSRYVTTKVSHVIGIGRDVEGRRKDGTQFPLHLSLAKWSNGAGEIGFTAIMRDITAQRNAQRALEESEHQLRLFMDCATEYAIYQLDLNNRFVKWNKGTERILGYSAAELDGLHIDRLYLDEDIEAGIPASIIAGAIKDGRSESEGWRVRKDGSILWASGVVQPIYEGGENVTGIAVILRDMTPQRAGAELRELAKDQAEAAAQMESDLREELQTSNMELKTANEGLQKFTSIVAHDLRAPLKRIDAFIDALREDYGGQLDKDGKEILTRINRGALAMKVMLDSMLDYSRYNAKAICGKTADLPSVIEGVIENCDLQGFESRIHVNAADAPRLQGDPILLAHVFQNLISNSIKFRRGDDLRIDIDVTATAKRVYISVTDNGIGVEPQFADQVFDMFYRLHNEDEYEGCGIGLTVCRKIVSDHGGRISIDKSHEGGTRVIMTLLPANDDQAAASDRAVA